MKQPNKTKGFSFRPWQITRIMKPKPLVAKQKKNNKKPPSGIGNYINEQMHKKL